MNASRVSKNKSKRGLQYALNIYLKSGDIIYLENLTTEEKDGYLEYCKTGVEKVILEYNNKIWRIVPDDIQKITYKSYISGSFEDSIVARTLLSESSIDATAYFTVLKVVVVFALLVFLQAGLQIISSGKIFEILTNIEKLNIYIDKAFSNLSLVFLVGFIFMVVINLVDLFLPTKKKYRIADENIEFMSSLKYKHILITVSYVIMYFVIVNVMRILLKIIF